MATLNFVSDRDTNDHGFDITYIASEKGLIFLRHTSIHWPVTLAHLLLLYYK